MYYDLGNCMEVEMKIFKRILKITIVTFMMIVILVEYRPQAINNFRVVEGEPVRVGVLLYKFDDAYISLVRQNLEEIEKNNEGKQDSGNFIWQLFVLKEVLQKISTPEPLSNIS